MAPGPVSAQLPSELSTLKAAETLTTFTLAKPVSPSLAQTAGVPADAPVRGGPIEKGWLGTRMQADLTRLKALKTSHYAIQLMTADAREKSAIENYLRVVAKELNPDRIMVYPAGTDDNPRVSVLYGNYTERADANGEIARLPSKLLKFNPYARSLQAIRDDIRPGQ